jgi:hypothetical protein
MTPMTLKNILGADFRSNPTFELVELAKLSPSEQLALPGLHIDQDCFGVLRPLVNSSLGLKSVNRDTALLFYALCRPGSLPAFAGRTASAELNAQIAGLVLDGVLQIAVDGTFVSGPAAHSLIYEASEPVENLGRIARISADALRFGQRLPIRDALSLSRQLYFFNRAPATPRWQRRLGDESALRQFTSIDSTEMSTEWTELHRTPATQAWRRWTLRETSYHGPQSAHGYKIYVSPTLEAIPDVLRKVIEVFAEKRVARFKIGADLGNLCRPDKIMAYLDTFEHVDEVARVLGERLGDVPVQGVPFTADLCHDGLVSWGMDPQQRAVVQGHSSVSWRLWITHRLATALLHARDLPHTAVEPWRFALERLRLQGIDTDTWTPLPGYRAADR